MNCSNAENLCGFTCEWLAGILPGRRIEKYNSSTSEIIIGKYARCQSNNNKIARNIIMCDVRENVIERTRITRVFPIEMRERRENEKLIMTVAQNNIAEVV